MINLFSCRWANIAGGIFSYEGEIDDINDVEQNSQYGNTKKQFLIHTRHGSYRARIWRDAKSHTYGAEVFGFPEEVVTFGTSLLDAKRMIKDAIELHCSCLIDAKKLVLYDTGRVAGQIPKSRVLVPA